MNQTGNNKYNKYNPGRLNTNCVFVTIARLIDEDYKFLINKMGLMEAEVGEDMSIDLPMWNARLDKIRDDKNLNAEIFRKVFKPEDKPGRVECAHACLDWDVKRIGVLYHHPGGYGHCIVFEPKTEDSDHFYDWQIEKEVKDEEVSPVAIFSITIPKDTKMEEEGTR